MLVRNYTTMNDIFCHRVVIGLCKTKQFYMNLLSFMNEFPTESSCKEHFLKCRIAKGISCQQCESTEHYWLKSKEQFQCKKCRFRTTLRSGTVLHSTKLPYRYWYIAMHLMTSTKKGFSAHEMQRQLGHKRYEPIWCLMRKIRESMGLADARKPLRDSVAIDDIYVSTYTTPQERRELKRGKGSQAKSKVTVMAESIPLEINGKPEVFLGRVKMELNTSENSEDLDQIAQSHITQDSIIFSDKSSEHVNLKTYFEDNIQELSMSLQNLLDMKWVNITTANLKRFLLGIYHTIKEKYIQYYLDEFCYKLNRRKHPNMFENLLLNSI